MAEELDKKKVTALSELTTTSDNDLYITGEGGQAPLRKISFGTIAAGILNKLSTWTFNALNTTTKTLTGAINELTSRSQSKRADISSSGDISALLATIISQMTEDAEYYFYGSWTTHSYGYAAHCWRLPYSSSVNRYTGIVVAHDGNAWRFSANSASDISVTKIPQQSEIDELNSNMVIVKSGELNVSSPPNSYTDGTVTYSGFSAVPWIGLTISSGSSASAGMATMTVGVVSRTTTSLTFRIWHGDDTDTRLPTIRWVAIGH